MGIEGRLTIDLASAPDRTGRVTIASSRPLRLTRVFLGKSAHETVRSLPNIFNICGLAQGAAAAQACEHALGIETGAETRAIRELLVLVETLREHLIRCMVDWPRFLGLERPNDEILRVMRLAGRLKKTFDPGASALAIAGVARFDAARLEPAMADVSRTIEELVLGEPIAEWAARRSADDLRSWAQAAITPAQQLVQAVLERGWADAGRAETHFLPPFADADLIDRLLGEGTESFVAAPTWDGVPQETSALGRQVGKPLVADLMRAYGSGLLTRITARIAEIADTPRAMACIVERCRDTESGEEPADKKAPDGHLGRGVAQIEAARGRLVHGVEIERDIVRRYAILAPTEWNFHAHGSAARGLAEIARRPGETRQIADLFITAIDPCVGYELRVR